MCRRGISFSTLQRFMAIGRADDHFIMAYLLLALACFLCPISKDVASPRLYAAVADVRNISAYNWPKFVLDWLVNEVRKYRTRASQSDTLGQASVGGCLFLLMIIYFEHTPNCFTMDDVVAPSRLAFWSTERVNERVRVDSTVSAHIPSHLLLRHPVTQKMYAHFVNVEIPRLCREQMEHIRRIDDTLMGKICPTAIAVPPPPDAPRSLTSPITFTSPINPLTIPPCDQHISPLHDNDEPIPSTPPHIPTVFVQPSLCPQIVAATNLCFLRNAIPPKLTEASQSPFQSDT